jgi:hypothetical protein
MAALPASDGGKSIMEVTAVEIPVNDPLNIRTEEVIQWEVERDEELLDQIRDGNLSD